MNIEIKNLSKDISDNRILNSINLKMKSGKIYGFKGKNGSGKTMLMRCICGLIVPTSGEVIIDDKILGKDISFPESIGALIESPGFIGNYTGFKNLKIIADIKGKIDDSQISSSMELLGLDSKDSKKFKKYSLGMKQKLGIVAALMENPKLIILDEPTNALDEASIRKLRDILISHRKRGALIIISCHDSMELNFLSDEIYFMEDGKIKENESILEDKHYENK